MIKYYNFFYDWVWAKNRCSDNIENYIMKHNSRYCIAAFRGSYRNEGMRLTHFYLTKIAWWVGDECDGVQKHQYRTRLFI